MDKDGRGGKRTIEERLDGERDELGERKIDGHIVGLLLALSSRRLGVLLLAPKPLYLLMGLTFLHGSEAGYL